VKNALMILIAGTVITGLAAAYAGTGQKAVASTVSPR
jgi:hypothetical protein